MHFVHAAAEKNIRDVVYKIKLKGLLWKQGKFYLHKYLMNSQ